MYLLTWKCKVPCEKDLEDLQKAENSSKLTLSEEMETSDLQSQGIEIFSKSE